MSNDTVYSVWSQGVQRNGRFESNQSDSLHITPNVYFPKESSPRVHVAVASLFVTEFCSLLPWLSFLYTYQTKLSYFSASESAMVTLMKALPFSFVPFSTVNRSLYSDV